MRLAFLFVFLFSFCYMYAQQESTSLVWVKLLVKDEANSKAIEGAQVISYETYQRFVTDSVGTFRHVFKSTDSLKVFGLSYEGKVIKVKEFIDNPDGMTISLPRRSYMIQEVEVSTNEMHLHLPEGIELGKKSDTPPALRSDDFSKKPPVLAALVSPISYVHYHTSKREKRKRNAKRMLAQEKEQDKINLFYNPEIIKEVSGYDKGDTLTNFIIYCNIHLKLSSRDNPLLVKEKIKALKLEFEQKNENK